MLVFLMRDLRVDLLHPDKDPIASQSVIYSDPNRSYPGEGEEHDQALHELYQRFHAHVLKLANSGYLSFVFDNVSSLLSRAEDPTLIAFTNPSLFDPPRIEMHIQRFSALDVYEGSIDDYEFESQTSPDEGREWKMLAEAVKEGKLLDRLLDRRIEVTSPWKKASFDHAYDVRNSKVWYHYTPEEEHDDEA